MTPCRAPPIKHPFTAVVFLPSPTITIHRARWLFARQQRQHPRFYSSLLAMPHTRSKLTLSYSTMRKSSSQPSLRSQYTTHSLPSYHHRAPSRHARRSAAKNSPPSYDDLMKTVDYRYSDQPPTYRSSFALSDIWEEDETEIEISSILPGSPEYADTIQLERRRKHFTERIMAFVLSLRVKLHRSNAQPVTNVKFVKNLDLLA